MRHLPASLAFAGLISCSSGDIATPTAPATNGSPSAAINSTSPLGTNLAAVNDWSTEWVFTDTFRMSRKWISQQTGSGWGLGPALALDANGWVTSLQAGQSADALMQWAGTSSGANGDYVVLYDGEGTLTFSGFATVTATAPGRVVIRVNASTTGSGFILTVSATNPANYLRNIRVLRPGYEVSYAAQPFMPVFLNAIGRFKVLRFMDWQMTNNSPLMHWADRTTPASATQTGVNGVALEHMIDLANATNADAWFNIPHLASDDYVLQCATLIKARLNPNLKAYVEYSNEVWNGQFQQASYAQSRGLALGLSANNFEAQLRYYSQRSVQVFKIFETVFSGAPQRLVRVLATQASNAWTSTTILDWPTADPAKAHADAVAIAPYFCAVAGAGTAGSGAANDPNSIVAMTTNQLLDYCASEIATTQKGWMDSQQAAISARGLQMITYEGGQHLVGVGGNENLSAMTNLFIDANRNLRMKTLYTTYLNQWRAAGGKLFMNFSSASAASKWGSWGMLEYQNQDPATAPKYQALIDFIAANPTPW